MSGLDQAKPGTKEAAVDMVSLLPLKNREEKAVLEVQQFGKDP